MQPVVEPARAHLTAAQIIDLIQGSESLLVGGGLEIVDLDLNVIEDISGDLQGGKVARDSYATMHGSATFRITRLIDWGGDLLRPYLTLTEGARTARFNLGVYHPSTPDWSMRESPPTYDVEGYDILLRLNQPVGDAYAINIGDSYLDKVEEILTGRGYTQYIIDRVFTTQVAPTPRTWVFDPAVTWLTIVNDLLAAVGYAGIWADWNGRLRCTRYQVPLDRAPEWIYSDDPYTTLLGTERALSRDYFAAPNRWVIYQSNVIEGATPVEGAGIYTYINQSIGDTSVDARRGLIITRNEGVDVADHASLIVRAQSIIDADMAVPTLIPLKTAPNPLHWHFDRLYVRDLDGLGLADVMCTSWELPLPPDTGDMTQQWRVLAS